MSRKLSRIYLFPFILSLTAGLSLGWLHVGAAAGFSVQATVAAPELTLAVLPDPVLFDTVSSTTGQRVVKQITISNLGNIAFKAVHAAVDPASLAGAAWDYAEATDPAALDDRTIALNVRHQYASSWLPIPLQTTGSLSVLPEPLAANRSQSVDLALLVGPNVVPGSANIGVVLEVTH